MKHIIKVKDKKEKVMEWELEVHEDGDVVLCCNGSIVLLIDSDGDGWLRPGGISTIDFQLEDE